MYDKKEYNGQYSKRWREKYPEKHKAQNDKYNPRRIRLWFKNKSINLKENPRTGICSWCGRIGKTDIHHIQYHDNDPLKDTIELCAVCHRKETRRLR